MDRSRNTIKASIHLVRRSGPSSGYSSVLEIRDKASRQVLAEVEMNAEQLGTLVSGLDQEVEVVHGNLSLVGSRIEHKTVDVRLTPANAKRLYGDRDAMAREAADRIMLILNKNKPKPKQWAFNGPQINWSQDSTFRRGDVTYLRIRLVRYV